jgi:hypothetical protein
MQTTEPIELGRRLVSQKARALIVAVALVATVGGSYAAGRLTAPSASLPRPYPSIVQVPGPFGDSPLVAHHPHHRVKWG